MAGGFGCAGAEANQAEGAGSAAVAGEMWRSLTTLTKFCPLLTIYLIGEGIHLLSER
mgnify:CR=1 FL=1